MSAPALPIEVTVRSRRPSLGSALLTVIVAALLMRVILFVVFVIVERFPGVELMLAHVAGLSHPWPAFPAGSVEALAGNAGAVVAASAVLGACLWVATGRRQPIELGWAFAAALVTCAVHMAMAPEVSHLLTAAVATVALRSLGYREDGSARPMPLGNAPVAVLAAAVTLCALGAVAWSADAAPVAVDRDVSQAVYMSPLTPKALAPADRVDGPVKLAVQLRNLGPRTVVIEGVLPGLAADGIRVVAARHEPASYYYDRPLLQPFEPLRMPPGETADLVVLLSDPGCRRRGPSALPLELRLAGRGPVAVTVPAPGCAASRR